MAKVFNVSKKEAWYQNALYFHQHMRDDRFTEAHAKEAGYAARKGEQMAQGTKAFRASYTGRKLKRFGHTRPLEYSGESRRNVRMASISSTSKGGKASYRGAAKFNFRHPKSKIRMNEEFTRLTQTEAEILGYVYDGDLNQALKKNDG